MGGGSSQQPVTQQTTQTRDPWSAAQGHLISAMGQAQNLFDANVGYQPYTGNTTAAFPEAMQVGIGRGIGLAESEPYGSENLAGARNFTSNLIANQGLNSGLYGVANRAEGEQNPFLQAILDTNNRRIGDRINAAMSGAGRYGSGQHADVMARALAESANPILAQDYTQRQNLLKDLYSQGLQRAGQAAEITPTLDASRFASSDALMQYGGIQRQYQQALLDQALKLYNAQQAYPWEELGRANAIFGQAGGLGGTQITSTPGATQPSTLSRILGGSLAGAGLGSSILPGVGTGIGALGGGLLGLL